MKSSHLKTVVNSKILVKRQNAQILIVVQTVLQFFLMIFNLTYSRMSMKYKLRSPLGRHRPDYTFVCGICGHKIMGKSNTIHLGIGKHIEMEYRQGLRQESNTSPRKYGDIGRKMI